jgi:hypothetical protein
MKGGEEEGRKWWSQGSGKRKEVMEGRKEMIKGRKW